MIDKLQNTFGKDAKNRLSDADNKEFDSAVAALESFYYAFNNKDIDVLKQTWLDHKMIRLKNPLGGVLEGLDSVSNLYQHLFDSNADVWVEFYDIIYYASGPYVIFSGREKGEFKKKSQVIPLDIRTTRVFQYIPCLNSWRQIHHHGSIDNYELLEVYQRAVKEN